MIEIALFQPDIAANAGAIARLCACFSLPLTVIEPAGFVWSDRNLRRAGMDYLKEASVTLQPSWQTFREASFGKRLVLLTTKAQRPYTEFAFAAGDILILGRESSGVPDYVRQVCEEIAIPMKPGMRSLNVAIAAAIAATEALRQLETFSGSVTASA